MNQVLRFLCYFVFILGILIPNVEAQQLVNYEETWQEFLRNPKTSSISDLRKPDKEQVSNYLKFSIMYATKYFCADDLSNAQKSMRELESMGDEAIDKVAGLRARYEDLKLKIVAYQKCGSDWVTYQSTKKVSLDRLEENVMARKVCEKGTLSKYFMMITYDFYCKGELVKSRDQFTNRVLKLAKTSFNPGNVSGLPEDIKQFKKTFEGLTLLQKNWATFIESDKSPGYDFDLPLVACYPIPNMKVYILKATTDVCANGEEMLRKIKKLEASTSHKIPADLNDKIEWLEEEVNKNNAGLAKITKIWDAFASSEEVALSAKYGYDFPCDREADVRAQLLDGFKNPCEAGAAALENIKKIKEQYSPSLSSITRQKQKRLTDLVTKESERIGKLNAAWTDFVPDNKLKSGVTFGFKYCEIIPTIKAYIMDGITNKCAKSKQRLQDIADARAEHNPDLSDEVIEKIDYLQALVDQQDKDLADLNTAWDLMIEKDQVTSWSEGFPQEDTVIRDDIRLVEFYCDKIAQTKSWCIKGHLDPCTKGQPFIKRIDALKKKHNLKYDKELACRVQRLRSKVYQCKYWKLVLKARQITHKEREVFGPKSSETMRVDLNSAEQPCETKVVYEPIGYIGVKYVISTYMCQKINLAKMGDPLFYKKIATWVESQVLTKYCEKSMRCKEDFFIYLEGHTDGNRFSGRSYKRSLGIAEGTPFTHFHGQRNGTVDTLQKQTRAISTKLKNNMELGIARAWTVKQQLEFMNVPIKVGAYEHPENEKGGEFRKVDIELNITNLLLDFYEKTLNQLVKDSGIGSRPKECQ